MANRTDPAVKSIHETNPQNLVEKILRLKIHENAYWKERCFGLTAETLVETRPWRPTTSAASTAETASPPPQCASSNYEERGPQVPVFLAFSVLFSSFFLQKRKKIPFLFDSWQVCSSSGAFYIRLTWSVADIYQYLEPLYNDSRKLRRKLPDGSNSAN